MLGSNLAQRVPEESEVCQMVGLHHRGWARVGGPGGTDLAEETELGRHHAVEHLEQPVAGERAVVEPFLLVEHDHDVAGPVLRRTACDGASASAAKHERLSKTVR